MSDRAKINLLSVIVVILMLALIGVAYQLGQRSSRPVAVTPLAPSPPSLPSTLPQLPKETEETTPVYSWEEAAQHYGEYATIEGQVVATYNSGKAVFLNFHPNWKLYFTAVIFASDFPKFPPNPEDYYQGKQVRVTGVVKEYQGKPEIILNSPNQIEVR